MKREHIHISEVSSRKMANGNEKKFTIVEHNGDLKEWVGFGWITIDSTKEEREKYPLVVGEIS